jgi:hypothetical protein
MEALDGGLARAVASAADRIRRRSLRPDVRFAFTAEIYADEERLAAARAELGLVTRDVPAWRSGYQPKEVLRLIRDKRYPIRCYIEYEYGSFRSSTEEVQRCFAYCKEVLA